MFLTCMFTFFPENQVRSWPCTPTFTIEFRSLGDFARNDDVYEELDRQKLNEEFEENPFTKERKPRSIEEMAIEASILKNLFPQST